MNRHALLFGLTFALGALIALAARTARHQPHPVTPPPAAASNPPAPAGASPAGETKPVNTICAICGMPVDPSLPTATYQGRTIGFGCRMCPPKFQANPDRYGPAYLRNEVLPR